MKKEKNYEFKKRLLTVHKENIRDDRAKLSDGEAELKNGVKIILPENAGRVIYTAAKDFEEYLFVSMRTEAMICRSSAEEYHENAVFLCIDEKTETDYKIKISDTIKISARDERGLARGLYCLEDKMSERGAPFIKTGEISQSFRFSPRMVHSGYGLDDYPNEHLAQIAHSGMDSILLFCKGINKDLKNEFRDFNELIYRAQGYGLDVYAYAYFRSDMHPDEEGAQEYFDSLYGKLFEQCPGFKGVILVGESIEFRTKDPKASSKFCYENREDGIPTGTPSAGWWPCCDYPKWLECVKKAVRKHRPDADIVFWTYNWGYAPEKDRINLINTLPTDISLLVTFEMFEKYNLDNTIGTVSDYTLSFEGPGAYFISEAEAASKRGIKLYAMANTAGMTWDMGMIPYQPMPFQWMKRYKALIEAQEKWRLCGLMESHHYGFTPSFISDLTKQAFLSPNCSMEEALDRILKKWYGSENCGQIRTALSKWSEAISCFTPSIEEQCGAFRVGPAFPLSLTEPIKTPSADYAIFGNGIVDGIYPEVYIGRESLPMLRIDSEIKLLEKMLKLIEEGTELLLDVKNKNTELEYLINLGQYMKCTVTTGLNSKKWHCLKMKMKAMQNRTEILKIIEELKSIAELERSNASEAIEYVALDSRLGWEPSMEYMCDEAHIRWKLKHLDYVINTELKNFELGATL